MKYLIKTIGRLVWFTYFINRELERKGYKVIKKEREGNTIYCVIKGDTMLCGFRYKNELYNFIKKELIK